MKVSRNIFIGVGVVVCSPLLLLALWICIGLARGAFFTIIGHPVDIAPWKLARDIAENNKTPDLCGKLESALPTMGPTLTEKRWSCFYELAKITKNPIICEHLLPTDYGWNCLGAAEENSPCVFVAGSKRTVKGNKMISTVDECIARTSEHSNNECCVMARIMYDEDATENCESFESGSRFANQCYRHMAVENREIETCNRITNDNIRTACEVAVRALTK